MDKIRTTDEILSDIIEPIIGDTPVSVQLAMALDGMASKEEVLVLRKELVELRKEFEKLALLVGDLSVSEQINMAMNKPEN